ncbi:MAG: ATP-binding protein [Pseudomonadota bacterium]
MAHPEEQAHFTPKFYLVGLSCLVFALIAAVAFYTSQVFFRLDEFNAAQSDNIQYTMAQLEVDHIKLLSASGVLQQSETADPEQLAQLRRRFNAFYSRTNILASGAAYSDTMRGTAADLNVSSVLAHLDTMISLMDGSDQALFEARMAVHRDIVSLSDTVNSIADAGVVVQAERSLVERHAVTGKLTELSIMSAVMILTMLALMAQLWQLYLQHRRRATDHQNNLKRLSTVLNTASDAILVVDKSGTIIQSNTAAVSELDLLNNDGSLRPVEEVLVRKDEAGVLNGVSGSALLESCRNGPNRCSKLLARGPDKDVFPVELSASLGSQDGQEVCVCYLRNISRRVEVETKMKATRDRALAGEQAQARFLGMISHEMRTPLNGILGTVDLLEDSTLSEEQSQYCRIIQSAGQQLLTQINDALDRTQVGSGQLSLSRGVFDLDELLVEAADSHSVHAEEANTKLLVSKPNPPLGLVEGDRARVLQVLVNLISNAVKFTRNGEVTVEASRLLGDEDCVEVQVIDTGVGISESHLKRIFDDFVRVANENQEDVPGTGLGLGIVRELLGLMGGKFGAESIEGEGSLFWVRLPLPTVSSLRQINRPNDSTTCVDVLTRTKPQSILVVEDNNANRFVLCEMLRKDGHSVKSAAEGISAIGLASQNDFDLILMDIRMPGIDGVETSKRIRASGGRSADARLIFLTAHIELDAPEQFSGLNAEAVIPKPLRRTALRDLVAGTLEKGTLPAISQSGPIDTLVLTQLRETLPEDGFNDLLQRFEREGDNFIRTLRNLREKPSNDVTQELHRFAGSAATFGATALRSALSHAEAALEAGDGNRAQLAIQTLPALWQAARHELKDIRKAA